ncbi:MAG TPA: dipeptide/oligopeptide/nickel ABC transporter permease/ATP-binding protein [Microterricola sp.]
MTETLPTTDTAVLAEARRRPRASIMRQVLRNPVGAPALGFLVFAVLVAIFGPLLAPHDPDTASAADVLGPMTPTHPLGTDSAGRDVLSRLLYATRFSLAGAAVGLIIAAVLGTVSGLIAGYFGKWFDNVSSWTVGLLQALPGMVVLLAARAVLGPSVWTSMAIFGVLLSPAFFRLVYASVTGVKNELYVDAARVSGLGDARIIGRHILSVVRAPVLIQGAVVAGIAIAIQSGLEFLGLGDLTLPTWGGMLNDGFANIYSDPILMLWPSLAIALSCISLVLLANALRDAIERSPSSRRPRSGTRATSAAASENVIRHETTTARSDVLLKIEHLTVGYDQPDGSVKQVVKDLSLTVHRGEVHGLIGESGSGKTQTAWSILQLLPEGGRVVGGSIVYDGTDLAGLSSRQLTRIRGRKIGYVPQEPMSNLDPAFTIGSQLMEPLRLRLGMSRREAKEQALAMLERVGIPHPPRTFAAYPHELSGGMAQRVLIAGAVSCNPELLIADEPTTALDVTVQAEVLDLLRDLQREFGMAMILVTHDFGVVADICDNVSVMRHGRIVETGPVHSVFAAPSHPYTQSLFDAILDDPGEPDLVPSAPQFDVACQGALR